MNKIIYITATLFICVNSNALTMKEYIKDAVENHPNIQHLRQTSKSIKGDIGIAESDYYPTVYARGAAGFEGHDFNNGTDKDGTTTEAEIGISYNIFDGNKRKYNKETESFRKVSADIKVKENINTFTLEAVKAYLEVLKQRELVKVSDEVLARHKSFLKKIKIKFDIGLGKLSELKKAESMYTTSNLNHSVHSIDLSQAAANLSYYTGKDIDPQSLVRPELNFEIPYSLQEALKIIEEHHPSIKVAKENIEITRSEMKRDVNSSKLPTLSVKGSYGYRDDYTYTDYRDEYSLMLEMSYNIFKGNESKYIKMKRYGALLEKYQLLDKAKKDTELRLKLAWSLYHNFNNKIELLKETYQIEKIALDTYHKEFQLGISDLMDISVAENDYIRSIKDLIRAQYDLIYVKFRIVEALGVIYNQVMDNTDETKEIFKDDVIDWNKVYDSLIVVEPVNYSEQLQTNPKKEKIDQIKPDCYTVLATSLNIRTEPTIQSSITGSYEQGDIVCGNKVHSGWLEVDKGWISVDFIKQR
ncbi:MAG: hypothetical protein C0602_10080 [Denitrovibrio sp.]|nr:MAG: hypothetical protein C0602_10080 [Denitrovibrio sp.]